MADSKGFRGWSQARAPLTMCLRKVVCSPTMKRRLRKDPLGKLERVVLILLKKVGGGGGESDDWRKPLADACGSEWGVRSRSQVAKGSEERRVGKECRSRWARDH